MLTITKLGMGTARGYFQKEFANASNSYFSEHGVIQGRWSGSLADDLGLSGAVTEEAYLRLMEGQDPKTGEQWIKHRDTYLTREGKEAGHIPAWDLTLSTPKSFSLAALVGEDERLIRAAQLANAKAMEVMEGYVQARGGGNHLPINTGHWVVATFQHDTSRPVDGYPAPQLHFHNVLMNVQRDFGGQFRALQSAELFKAKSLGAAVFYSELQRQAHALGYETRIDPTTKAPEIKGFSQEYLAAESLRRQEILERLDELGVSGSRATQIAALTSREDKLKLTPDELRALHQAHGGIYGSQAQRAYSEALERGPVQTRHIATPASAVDFAERRLSERNAVFEHYELVRDALRYGRGSVDVHSVEVEVRKRVREERLIPNPSLSRLRTRCSLHHPGDGSPGARSDGACERRRGIGFAHCRTRRFEPLSAARRQSKAARDSARHSDDRGSGRRFARHGRQREIHRRRYPARDCGTAWIPRKGIGSDRQGARRLARERHSLRNASTASDPCARPGSDSIRQHSLHPGRSQSRFYKTGTRLP
jgi:conjugative relaxase-like TrwC/TraI family protein